MCLLYSSPFFMCVNIIYVCICLYCVICLILYYRSLLICTNKEFMNNIYDCILDNYVLSAACNSSSHNVVSLSIVVTNFSHVIESNCNPARTPNCIWSKASIDDIKQYQLVLDNKSIK